MRNLFAFIARFHVFLLFLLLEGFALALVVRYNHFQRGSFINSSNQVVGKVYQKADDFKQYIDLTEVNDSLLTENVRLRNQIKQLHRTIEEELYYANLYPAEYCAEDSSTHHLIAARDTNLLYKHIGAKVMNSSFLKPNNFLTINKGRQDGILREMGVVGNNGIVGIVKEVSDHFATIISILHKSSRISIKIKRNHYTGSLIWTGASPQYATIEGISRHVRLKKGDKIVTSGGSAIFPGNIPVGIIEDWILAEGSSFYEIKVKLSTDFSSVPYVYAIDYTQRAEQKALEEKPENE